MADCELTTQFVANPCSIYQPPVELNDDDLLNVFKYLTIKDLVRFERVNKQFAAVCSKSLVGCDEVGEDFGLNLNRYATESRDEVAIKFISRFGSLRTINLKFAFDNYNQLGHESPLVSNEFFTQLARFSNLQRITSYFTQDTIDCVLSYVTALAPDECQLKSLSLIFTYRLEDLAQFNRICHQFVTNTLQLIALCPKLTELSLDSREADGQQVFMYVAYRLNSQILEHLCDDMRAKVLSSLTPKFASLTSLSLGAGFLNSHFSEPNLVNFSCVNLRELCIPDIVMERTLRYFLKIAPNLNSICFGAIRGTVTALSDYQHLRCIKINVFSTEDDVSDFERELRGVLAVKGHNLVELELRMNQTFERPFPINFMTKHCPKLRRLSLINGHFSGFENIDKMRHLRSIQVSNITVIQLKIILNISPKIRTIDVISNRKLLYDVIANFLEQNEANLKREHGRVGCINLIG